MAHQFSRQHCVIMVLVEILNSGFVAPSPSYVTTQRLGGMLRTSFLGNTIGWCGNKQNKIVALLIGLVIR